MKFFLIFIGLTTIINGNAYVLLQVRKGDNESNVDALIHKVLPNEKIDKSVKTARKQFDSSKYSAADEKDQDEQAKNGLESFVLAIDSGASSNDGSIGKADAFDRIIQKISKFLQEGAINVLPKYRTELEKFHIKPEIVHFRSGKPSVMFEVNTKEVLRSIQSFLASKEVKHYTDRVANRAAVIYRAVKDEIMKQ